MNSQGRNLHPSRILFYDKHPSRITHGLVDKVLFGLFSGAQSAHQKRFRERYMKCIWNRIRQNFALSFFIRRAKALFDLRLFQQATSYILACAPEINRVVKQDRGIYFRRNLVALYASAVDLMVNMLFRSITEQASDSLPRNSWKIVLDRFSAFEHVQQLSILPNLLCQNGDNEQMLAVETVKATPFYSKHLNYFSEGMIEEVNRNWVKAIEKFKECRGIAHRYAFFRAAQIMIEGLGGVKFPRKKGEELLEILRTNGYEPAIKNWLEQFLIHSYTPQRVAEAYEKLDQCTYWTKIDPTFKTKLLAKLRHLIKKMRQSQKSWQDSLDEHQDRIFEIVSEDNPQKRRIDAADTREVYLQNRVSSESAELEEAVRISNDLHARYDVYKKEAEKRRRNEAKEANQKLKKEKK